MDLSRVEISEADIAEALERPDSFGYHTRQERGARSRKIHKRESIVRLAELDITEAVHKITEKHKLTTLEMLCVVNGAMSGVIGSIVKYEIRNERHGNYDKPGGLAGDEEDNE